MLNIKFIKIIIIILIILILPIGFIFIQKNKTKKTVTETNQDATTMENRVIFKTKNTNNVVETDYSTSSEISTPLEQKTNVVEYQQGPDDLLYTKTSKLLFDWNTTKDPEILKTVLKNTEGADNEGLLEVWRPFMQKNSSELIKIIDTSPNIKQTKSNIRLIFEWYIDLSGDFEKLSSVKKQELMRQYQLVK
jgi:exopolysaccharide biosynthesis protein